MENIHNAVAWYQKKIGSYDKQLWEQSVEQKVLVKGLRHAPRKSGRVKTELIDVDLVKGSTFTKAKPQLPWIVITKMTFVRVLFFPLYYKWWTQQTCRAFCAAMLVLYMLHVTAFAVFIYHWNLFISKPNISLINLVVPTILMVLLGLIHSQTVLSHVTHKPPIHDAKVKRRLKTRVKKNGNNCTNVQSNGSVKYLTRLDDVLENTGATNAFKNAQFSERDRGVDDGERSGSGSQTSEKESDIQTGEEHCVETLTYSPQAKLSRLKCLCMKSGSWNAANDVAFSRMETSPRASSDNSPNIHDVSPPSVADIRVPQNDGSMRSSDVDTKNDYLNAMRGCSGLDGQMGGNDSGNEKSTLSDINGGSGLGYVNHNERKSLNEGTKKCVPGQENATEGGTELCRNVDFANVSPVKGGENTLTSPISIGAYSPPFADINSRDCYPKANGVPFSASAQVQENHQSVVHKVGCIPDDIKRPNLAPNVPDEGSGLTRVNQSRFKDNELNQTSLSRQEDLPFHHYYHQVRSGEAKDDVLTRISCSDTDASLLHISENCPIHRTACKSSLKRSSFNIANVDPDALDYSDETKLKRTSLSSATTSLRRRRASNSVGDASLEPAGSQRSRRQKHWTVRIQEQIRETVSSSDGESEPHLTRFNKAAMSSEECEDRMQSDVANSSSTTSSMDSGHSDRDTATHDDPTAWSASMTHVMNLLQPSSSTSHVMMGQPDKVSCMIWEGNECKKVDLTALDIGWAIIEKVDKIPESSDYIMIGTCFSVLMAFVPLLYKVYLSTSLAIYDIWKIVQVVVTAFSLSSDQWMFTVININGMIQRFCLGLAFFFLLSVADRTFKQRLLYAKHFCYLTSSRRSRKYDMPHFRLNKVCNIKAWLSLRSYLKKRGPQRSVDVIVSSAFIMSVIILALMGIQLLKDTDKFLENVVNWDLFVWCLALNLYILRYMTLGLKINKKYRNLSVLITEQINLYLQMEQKPHKKEELMISNNVLKLAEELIKELESPFKISGMSANPLVYNIMKVILLSAFSAVLTELLGFKLKLYKIKMPGT